MRIFAVSAAAVGLSLALCPPTALSRQIVEAPIGGSCGGPVFKAGEVTRKARIKRKPVPGFTDEARAQNVHGVVRLTAVLCRTGRVTDITVVKGLPAGMTELAVEAARRIRFDPAVRDGRKVSQALTLEYRFRYGDEPDEGDVDPARSTGRLVEQLLIEGNRRLTDEQLAAHLRTRPGDVFAEATVRRDLQTLLELGTLDTKQTRITLNVGPRGGVVVIFTVVELPVIRAINFKGLRSVSPPEALAAIEARAKGLRREGVFHPSLAADARLALLELLASRGRHGAAVQIVTRIPSSTSVEITFVVNEGPPARGDGRPGRWF